MTEKVKIKTMSVLLIFIIGSLVGGIIGMNIKKDNSSEKEDSSEILQLNSENAALKSQIEGIKAKFPPTPEMRFVPGKVLELGADFIVIDSSIAAANPLEDLPKTRTVAINSTTPVATHVKKTELEIQQEIQKYSKFNSNETLKSQATATNIQPSPFKEIPISLSAIKVGDLIVVDAGHDVKLEEKFTAEKIILQSNLK